MNPGDPVLWAAAGCAAVTLHSAFNAVWGRRATPVGEGPVDESVSVLVPARNEAHRIAPCLNSLLAQRGLPRLEVIVLDDESTDDTAGRVRAVCGQDPRVRLLSGRPLPAGWLGKPHACRQLADAATPASRILIFMDADVRLTPHALVSLVIEARRRRAGLLACHLSLKAVTPTERLFQPMTAWFWLGFLPLRAMQRLPAPHLASAEGQLMVFDREAYERAGGHSTVRQEVLEDNAIARAVKAAGGRLALADASALASCRMYGSWRELADGYAKSLCTLAPLSASALAVLGLCFLYVLPPVAACNGSAAGLLGYALAVAGRWITARASGDRVWPDILAHPASVLLTGWLLLRSHLLDRRGARTWKGRSVQPSAHRPGEAPSATGS